MKYRLLSLSVGILCASGALAQSYDYDVVVYGGTSGAVTAAVQAARMGKSVVLIDPGDYVGGVDGNGDPRYVSHLGGLSSGGLGATDVGDSSAIGGLAYDFYRCENLLGGGSGYDVHAGKAEQVYDSMVEEAGVTVKRLQRLDRASGVSMTGVRINSITTLTSETYNGSMFIDGTYEGDLMDAAGVKYTVGREPRSQYGETYNGIAYDQTREHVFGNDRIDPYDANGQLIEGVHLSGPDPRGNGAADNRIQAYCYRMTWTNSGDRIKWTDLWGANGANPPDGYDRDRYEVHDRYIRAGNNLGDVVRLDTSIGGGKNDINNWGPASTDFIGGNYNVEIPGTGVVTNYAEATHAEREYIIDKHIEYTKGFLYYLAFDAPASIRNSMDDWGLASDEFTDNENFPHQLYVREARRMIGEYVMTEANCRDEAFAPNPIGLGAYPMDSHNTHRYVDTDGKVEAEGNFWLGNLRETYEIDYGSITPKTDEAGNLLVPLAVSASHTAFGSMRMEPVFMVLGQSAGTAAVRAMEEGTDVQGIDLATYQAIMRAYGQKLTENDEPPVGPFVGTMTEEFNYGPDDENLNTVSYIAPGFAEPWDADGADPVYDGGANLTYDEGLYKNASPVGVSGSAGAGTGLRAGHIAVREIAGGMSGEVWMSVLMSLDAVTDQEALLWLDGTGSDDALGIAEGGSLELFGQDVESGLADGKVHLLLAKMIIGSGADSIELWLDPDLYGGEDGLGEAILSMDGSDLFGSALNQIGVSTGSAGGAVDAFRMSNTDDGFVQVTGVPEPTTLGLLAIGAGALLLRRRR